MSIRRWSVYEEHAKKNGNAGWKGSQAFLSSLNIRPVTRKKAVKRAKGKKKGMSNAERRSAKVTNNAQRSMETSSAPLKTLAIFLLAVTVFPPSTSLFSSLFVSVMLATRSKGWSKGWFAVACLLFTFDVIKAKKKAWSKRQRIARCWLQFRAKTCR